MELTQKQNIQMVAALLFLTAITQIIYTALYNYASDVPRQWLWGLEALVFVVLIAIAGSTLSQAKKYTLGFSAIFASAILNFIQVGVGITQFGPFFEVAKSVEAAKPAAGAIVAYSFFIYNGAKVLLAIAALVFGAAVLQTGSKLLGWLTIVSGVVALSANTIVIMFGRVDSVPSGATGVVATLLLAVCVLNLSSNEDVVRQT